MMGSYPTLFFVLLTYATDEFRREYAHRTLRAFLDRVIYSGQVSVHIADDGSPAGHVEELATIAGGYPNVHGVSMTNAERGGYGKSYNLAVRAIRSGPCHLFLPCEDDWEMSRAFNFNPLVEALMAGEGIDCIRLGYLGWTQELRGRLAYVAGQHFLVFDPECPERHVFAGHPRIVHVRYEDAVGPWREDLAAGATEFELAGRPQSRRGVAWPLDAGLVAGQQAGSLFPHIGTVPARTD